MERDEVVEELCTAGDGSMAPYGCPRGRAEWVPFKGAARSAQRAVIWMLWAVPSSIEPGLWWAQGIHDP